MWEKTRSHSMGVMSFLNQYFIFSRTSSMTRTITVEVLLKKKVIHRFISPRQSAAFQNDFWSYSTLHADAVQLLGCPAAPVLKPHLSRILLMAFLQVSPDSKLSPDFTPQGSCRSGCSIPCVFKKKWVKCSLVQNLHLCCYRGTKLAALLIQTHSNSGSSWKNVALSPCSQIHCN